MTKYEEQYVLKDERWSPLQPIWYCQRTEGGPWMPLGNDYVYWYGTTPPTEDAIQQGIAWNRIELSTDPFRDQQAKEKHMALGRHEDITIGVGTADNGYTVEQYVKDEGRKSYHVFETFDSLTAHLRKVFAVDALPAQPTKRR